MSIYQCARTYSNNPHHVCYYIYIYIYMCVCVCVCVCVYVCVLSTVRLFSCITTLQCSNTRDILLAEIKTLLTLHQSDILPQTIVILSASEIIFYV